MSSKNTPQIPPFDYSPPPYKGPSKSEVLETRRKYLNPGIFSIYREPLMIVEGRMQYLYDETGRRYLDLLGGICTIAVGHCHPKVLACAEEQMRKIQHTTTIYLNPAVGELAKKLAAKMPPGLDCSYIVNSGSEANDLAILMARLYTGNFDVLAVRNGYHGGVATAMALTSHSTWKFPSALGLGVHHVISPDPYRSPYGGSPEEITARSVEDIREIVRYSTSGKIAAFIAEPMQGVGGVTYGRHSYLKRAYEAVREFGGLCVADEVQTGFGRTGENYWGFQNHDAEPDIVTMAKSLGNGIPIAAVTTRREIAETLKQRVHFNTFGGNPVSCAQASAVIDVIDQEGLQQNAKLVGKRFRDGLLALMERHRLIGDVRGMGLMIGFELVKDRAAKTPAKEETLEFMERAREMGVLLGKGGLYGNTIRLKPPMCVNNQDADFALEVFDQALNGL